MVLDAPLFLISGAAEKLCFRFEYLNGNVPPLFDELVVMRNLMNQIADMGGLESLQQLWYNHPHNSCTGVGYQNGSDGLSFIGNSSASTLVCCRLYLAKSDSHVELGERVPQMVGTGQIKLGKLMKRLEGDFTWQSKNCSLKCHLPYRASLCNFTPTDRSSTSLGGSSLVL